MHRRLRSSSAAVRPAAILVAALLCAGLAPLAARAAESGGDGPAVFAPRGLTTDRFPAVTQPVRVDVPAHDGIALHARVFRPDTASDPAWKTPVILVHSPYYDGLLLGDDVRSTDIVARFTPKGYTVVLSDLRGTGNSGGCGEQDGANQARDFRTLVEHFARQPWSNGKVGGYGKSYDAESQNAGAVLQPEGLATMVTVAGISSLYDVAYFDGVPLTGAGLLSAAAYELYDLDVPGEQSALPRRAERHTCQPANFVNGADPSGDETAYWAERDFRPGVKKVQASVLYVQGLNDPTVTSIDIDGWYDELPTFKRAIFGQWAHKYPYDAPNDIARDDWYDSVHAWFDSELLGLDTGVRAWPRVQVQAENDTWRAVESADGMGEEQALPVSLGAVSERAAATWDSPVLPEGLHLSGQVYLDATIAIDRDDAHFAVTVQEVKAGGAVRKLTTGYLSATHRESFLRPVPVMAGHPTPYRIRTYPFDRTLAPGSKLRVVLAGSDGATLPAGNSWAGTVSPGAILRLPVVRQVCGLEVARRTPTTETPGCPEGIPAAVPKHDPGAANGHVATARVTATGTETVGGVAAVRESGYLTMRDGVELAFEVIRPAAAGAKTPVLLTYDGYDAGTNPDSGYAARYLPKGYALAGLSLRGTGCSGGTFDFFQPAEAADGYEAVEWLAAQPWSNQRVAMIGKSYPGITQLFVAEAQPPHLVAITPGHFFGDAYRDIAFPGGIFNKGFASLWSFIAQPAPGFQSSPGEIAKGDQTCAANRKQLATNLRTNPFLQAQEHPYSDLLIAERSPLTRLDRIKVPVYAALSWQDEQLMSRQTHLLTALQRQGTPYRAVLANGDHGMYRRGPQLAEMDRFLDAHVLQRDKLADGTARTAYLAEPPVSVFWEQGTGQPRWRSTLPAWGDQAAPQRLYLGAGSALVAGPPAAGAAGSDTYAHSAAGSQGIGNPKWGTVPADVEMWDKYSPPAGAALAYTTAPFAQDTVLLGPASADLWITATAPNVDFQVTVTEIRPDGREQYVAQGWLRGSQRFLDRVASTELLPVQTHQQADVRSFSPTEPALTRIEVFPFGHAVRAGSKLRIWIEAPTALPQLESFLLDPKPAAVTVWRDAAHPSSLVLPVLAGATIPAAAGARPACGTVLRQPCRANPR